jgi:signal peptidase I
LLKSKGPRPELFIKKAGELSLSGPVLIELLRAVLDKGKPFRFRAKGVSMTPFVKDGDVITVSPFSGASPRMGDVVAFIRTATGKLVVHRMVGKSGDSFLIKGDNVDHEGERVPEKNVLGRVVFVERNGQRVRLGLGVERFVIAFLNQRGLLQKVGSRLWRFVRPLCWWRRGSRPN